MHECFEALERDHVLIEAVSALLAEALEHASDEQLFELGAFTLVFFQRFADRCHHGKEEQALFPLLEARGIPRDRGPIGMMLLEHQEARRLLADQERALRSRSRTRFVASAGAYCGLLRAHISKERGALFPLGDARLTAADDLALRERFAELERAADGPRLREESAARLARWQEQLAKALAAQPPHALAPR